MHNGAVLKRLLVVLGSIFAVAAGAAGAGPTTQTAYATARAFDVRVTVPGGAGGGTQQVTAPPQTVAVGPGFSYGDGGAVSTGSMTANASADTSSVASSSASADVSSVSLFGGEVTASAVSARAKATAQGASATGDLAGSGVSGLTVLGQAVGAGANPKGSLGDWGYAVVLEQSASTGSEGGSSFHAFVVGLDVHLTATHGGLPAGTVIQVGYAEANAQAPPAAATTATTPPATPGSYGAPGGKGPAKKAGAAPEPTPTPGIPPLVLKRPPPGLHPKLTAGGYVFPVYGPSSFTDTFGAPRADVSWHHGDDIFAPLGAPLLAVADGTVFSVGWNDIGGYRLWLRDRQGNEFYYAHLSAYSPLAVNGQHVHAGDVLGFMGNTGDAEGTPYHLHFEVHPVGLLGLGYDGAVDPTAYLEAWKHLQDVRFSTSSAWVPLAGAGSSAPRPGAILLQVSDISSADGLDPGSLRRVFAEVSREGDGAILRAALGPPAAGAPVEGGPAAASAAARH
jgi:murein DD-endopeptidase MepM/ murein hydrolase activator NlpD